VTGGAGQEPGEAGRGSPNASPVSRSAVLLSRVVAVAPHEVRAMLASFAFFFFVLSSYFILRPIRDAVGVAAGVSGLPWLFAGTLVAMLVANPLFSALVVRFPVRRFIPITYHFFAANLLLFYAAMRWTGADTASGGIWIGPVFYIWTSVFNLFVVSVFWSFMADVFHSEAAKRLFGFIGVGGTLGSIAGSTVTAALALRLGTVNLLLVSIALLEIAVLVVVRFPARPRPSVVSATLRADHDAVPIGGSVWAGFTGVVRSPYLLAIAAFLMLYTIGSTFLYFQQADIIRRAYTSSEARAAILARIEVAVQTLTVLTQIFLTGRIMRWLGLAVTLALLPAVSVIGFGALGTAPVLATVVAFTVIRRGTNFAITNPAMEVLFTVVSREDKYKAKSFIETFVYRAGDQVAAWIYRGLDLLGLGVSGTAFVAVPFAATWLGVAFWLGHRQARLAAGERAAAVPSAAQSMAAS
jgi:AAA family ATP:ADP antiporter